MNKNSNLIIHGGLLFVAILYGANYSIAKIVTPEFIAPFGMIVYRILLAGVLFWLISFDKKEKVNWKKDGNRFFLCALTGVAANQLLFFKGISLTTAVNASIIMTLTPIFVFIFSAILLHEKISGLKFTGLILSLLGALLIVYKFDDSVQVGNWLGDILVLLNALSYGMYLVLVKPLMGKYSTKTVTKWIFLIGFFIALPVGGSDAINTDFSSFTDQAWYSFFYVIVGVTIIAYFINAWSMKKVNPSLVGIYIYLQPLLASLVAVLFFDELLTGKHAISAIFIFSGIYMVNYRPKSMRS